MKPMQISDIADSLQGELLSGDCRFESVCTDSRTLQPGDLFVALTGEQFDGHDYIEDVVGRGASGAVVSIGADYSVPCLKVSDTQLALGQLAALNRDYFTGPLIGITGSSGKTTVKNMLTSICSQRGVTHATGGNFNNEIGAPLTLLGLSPEHEFAVIEMGAAGAGDIAYLAGLARPAVSVLLNAMPAHLEGFGSVDGVARAKGEIYQALAVDGIAVVNADSEYRGLWEGLVGDRSMIRFGLSEDADVRASAIDDEGALGCRFQLHTPVGDGVVNLQLIGAHNVMNALAAAAAAHAIGLDLVAIAAGLEQVQSGPGRLYPQRVESGALVVDDSYNANPGSVEAAIDLLVASPGRGTLILGFMAELGPDSDALHEQVGRYASSAGLDRLWLVGKAAAAAAGFGSTARVFENTAAVSEALGEFDEQDVVLVKGSRSAGMEAVVSAFTTSGGGD